MGNHSYNRIGGKRRKATQPSNRSNSNPYKNRRSRRKESPWLCIGCALVMLSLLYIILWALHQLSSPRL